MKRHVMIHLLCAITMLMLFAPPAAADHKSRSDLLHAGSGELVGTGASTTITRYEDSALLRVKGRDLTAGHAITLWAIIFNTPDGCSDGACGEDDLFNAAATPSVTFSGLSGVVDKNGKLDALSTLSEGNPEGRQQLLADLGAPDAGLVDAQGAEIHFVVRDHGPSTGDPAQTMTFEGGCTPGSSFGLGSGTYECVDPQFSVHLP